MRDSPFGPPHRDPPARRPRRSRLPLLLLPPVAAIGVLTSCEEPTPLVTVQSGSAVVKANATAYVWDDEVQRYDQDVPVLSVHLGDRVNIDVERNLAAQGWFVTFEGEPQTPVVHDHAASVLVTGFTRNSDVTMRIWATSGPLPDAPLSVPPKRGVWIFKLVQKY